MDYLVITPAELASEAQRLADYRQGQGLKTKVVLLTDIYDEFNHGMAHPKRYGTFCPTPIICGPRHRVMWFVAVTAATITRTSLARTTV